jgi:hypothetical protein
MLNFLRLSGPYFKDLAYNDFRKMLDKMCKQIDAVTVSTPDHTHAIAAMMAMKRGKHVYCQKPLTHTVREARELRLAARKYSVCTQMGNQGSAENGLRRAIGVQAVHFTNLLPRFCPKRARLQQGDLTSWGIAEPSSALTRFKSSRPEFVAAALHSCCGGDIITWSLLRTAYRADSLSPRSLWRREGPLTWPQ